MYIAPQMLCAVSRTATNINKVYIYEKFKCKNIILSLPMTCQCLKKLNTKYAKIIHSFHRNYKYSGKLQVIAVMINSLLNLLTTWAHAVLSVAT